MDTLKAEILSEANSFFRENRKIFSSLNKEPGLSASARQLHLQVHNFKSLSYAFGLSDFTERVSKLESALSRFENSNASASGDLGALVDELSDYLNHLSQQAEQPPPSSASATFTEVQFDEDMWELIFGFVEESLPFLERVEALNLEFSEKPLSAESLNEYLRILHTLKGTAASVGLADLKVLLHAFEDFVLKYKGQQIQLPSDVLAILSAGSDAVAEGLLLLKEKKVRAYTPDLVKTLFSAAQKPGTDGDPLKSRSETIPVDVAKLDEFIEITGRFTLIGHMMGSSLSSLTSKYPQDGDLRGLRRMIESMEVENSKLQESADSLREVSLEVLFRPLKRMVRELGEQLGKQVKFQVEGDTTKVSRPSAKMIANCLVHLLRNSLDHGIENPAERTAAGKTPHGTLVCRIHRDDEKIQVQVSDDGKGIDPVRIKRKALEKGLKTQKELDAMSEPQVLALIFESGFSTAEKVSDVSGRGVGMDMVRQEILSVRGKINIDSKVGQGSTFEIVLPLSKASAIAKMVMIHIGNRTFAIPSAEMLQSVDTKDEMPMMLDGRLHHKFNDRFIPLFDLNANGAVPSQIVVIGDDTHLFAIAADQVMKESRLVLRDLDPLSQSLCPFTTTALEGHNKAHLVLNCESAAKIIKMDSPLVDDVAPEVVAQVDDPVTHVAASVEGSTPSEVTKTPSPAPRAVPTSDFLPEIGQMRSDFYGPALEKLNACESRLLEMERDSRADHWQALKQDFHSLKGDSRVLGFERFATIVHFLESFFGKRKPDPDFFKFSISACDILRRYIELLQAGGPADDSDLERLGDQLAASKKKS